MLLAFLALPGHDLAGILTTMRLPQGDPSHIPSPSITQRDILEVSDVQFAPPPPLSDAALSPESGRGWDMEEPPWRMAWRQTNIDGIHRFDLAHWAVYGLGFMREQPPRCRWKRGLRHC